MDDWMVIISLSLAMLVGCYLAGCIPLAFSFSEEKLKLLTIFGAGLLVGTALAIIIPEGVNAIYSQSGHSHAEKLTIGPMPDVHVHSRKLRAAEVPAVANPPVVPAHDHAHDHAHEHAHNDEHAESHNGGTEHEHHHDEETEHKSIGVSLVIGFVFMLVVDQIGGGHSHGGGDSELQVAHTHSRNKITATLGLCVHAAADGIALGAATSVSQTGLTIVVFVAIMLHKAPAAFGLVSFLLHDGLDRGRIRRHLFLFSVAAPIGAILTFLVLNHQSKETLQQYNATGIAMLFSAGTFLYVATVHILPEVSSKSSRTISSDGTVIVREHKGFTKLELITIILGSMLPVVISFTIGHGHSH